MKKKVLIAITILVIIGIGVVLYFILKDKKGNSGESKSGFSGFKETISLPNSENKETTYVVKEGDTLSALAVTFGTSVDKIVQRNGIENPDLIIAGQTLYI